MLCRRCHRQEAAPNLTACRECLDRIKATRKTYSQLTEGQKKAAREVQLARYHALSPSEKAHKKQLARERMLRIKRLVLEHYGGRCECCGVDHWQFLTLDHPDGDGELHREEMEATGSHFYEKLYTSGFQSERRLRILCFNCHWAIDWHGGCPHQVH